MSSQGSTNGSWLPRYEQQLDADQRAIMLDDADVGDGQTTLVSGPAGTGKTAIAVYLCKRLADERTKFILIAYNPLLVDYMKSAFTELGLDASNVISLNSWILNIYRKYINPGERDEHSPEIWKIRAKNLRTFLERNPPSENAKQFIVIDEVQDVSEDQVHIIKALAHTVYATGDRAQAIAGLGGKHELKRLWQAHTNHVLLRNYRTTKRLAALAALFLDETVSGMRRHDFANETRGRVFEAPIESLNVSGWNNHIDMASRKARDARDAGRTVCILLPTFEQVDRALAVPAMIRLSPTVLSARNGYKADGGIHITTVHSVKGLEFDHVVMPCLTADVWDNFTHWGVRPDAKMLDRYLFVSMTRTRNWLTLIMDLDRPASFVGRIRDHLGSATGSAPAPF